MSDIIESNSLCNVEHIIHTSIDSILPLKLRENIYITHTYMWYPVTHGICTHTYIHDHKYYIPSM